MSAIAAVLAFSSTALTAQAVPEATQPVTQAPVTPMPVTVVPESAPVAPTANEPPATVSEPLAPDAEPATAAKAVTSSSKFTTTHRTASVARAAKAAPPAARAAAAPPVAPPLAEPAASPPAPAPLVAEPAAQPPAVATAPPVQEAPAASNNNMLPIAGAAVLGLLALIGLAVALRRRKLRREEEFTAVAQVEPEYEGPAPVDPLFAEQPSAPLAAAPAAAAIAAEPALAGPCADAAPGSHVEAACDGPTEDNPSLSIKKRLKRAQFFDQREQMAAAGMAVPVETDAGLPDAVEGPESELAPGTREPA